MKKYKLTDQNLKTHNGFQWEIGKKVQTDGKENELCNSSWLHYYDHPLLAILLNPIHANISNPRLFEVKALGKHLNDRGLKGGCTKMTLVKEIELPIITQNQKIAFAILCSLEVYHIKSFIRWAKNWLNGKDRSHSAANANAAAAAAAAADAYAAAANADAYAAANADAYAAANAAANAADADAYAAANVAAYAANAAANAADALPLIKLAKKALKIC
jgi:hypothetical protein